MSKIKHLRDDYQRAVRPRYVKAAGRIAPLNEGKKRAITGRVDSSAIRHQTRQQKNRQKYTRFIRELVRSVKDEPCADCGVRYPYYIMEFDHCRGEKIADIHRLMNAHSLDLLIDEMDKCDVVCSNCHRERTHQRRIRGQ